MNARIGFCCTFVSPTGDAGEQLLLNMRQPTIASIARLGVVEAAERLEEVIEHNLATLERQVLHVAALPPLERLFRVLSGFLIGWSHPVIADAWTKSLRREVERRLDHVGDLARRADVRLSMHPSQHAILATQNPAALDNAVGDIEEHATIFAMLGYGCGWHPGGASVNIHGGARAAGIEGLGAGLDRLSQGARQLVTIENDEMSFGLDDLLQVADNVAIVVDFHHHWIFSRGEWLQPDDERVARIQASWRGVRPLAHISVSRESIIPGHDPDVLPDFTALVAGGHKAAHLRGHSDRMWNRAVNALVQRHLVWCDVEVEAKAKNLASRELADFYRACAA